MVAALLGWLGDPLVDRLERRGRSRNLGVVLVFTLMVLLLVLALLILVPLVERQLVDPGRVAAALSRLVPQHRAAVGGAAHRAADRGLARIRSA